MDEKIPLSALNVLGVNMYTSAAALVILVWDHLLTIDREVSLIWDNPRENYYKRAFFFANRYFAEAMLAYATYATGLALNLDNNACLRFQWIFGLALTVFFVSAKVIISLRIYNLWGRKRRIGAILIGALVTVASVTVALSVVMEFHLQAEAAPLEPPSPRVYKFCYYSGAHPAVYPVYIGALAVFDLFAILLIVLNALDRPYQSNIDVVVAVQRDGVKLFVGLFALRLGVLVLAVNNNTGAISLAPLPLLWALAAIANSRLHFQIGGMEKFELLPDRPIAFRFGGHVAVRGSARAI